MVSPIKKIALPFQVVLLRKRMCPGCTESLDNAGKRTEFKEKKAMVQCKCKRRYIYDFESNSYRRATFEEEREFLNKTGKLK